MAKEIDWNKPPRAGYVFVDVVSGVEGPCLTIGDHSSATRVAGPKPWGGGKTMHRFEIKASEIRDELDSYEKT